MCCVQLWHHVQSSVGEGRGTLTVPETLWLIAFLAWAPLFVWLPRQHPAAYRRLRTPLVLLSRLHCQLTRTRSAAECWPGASSACKNRQSWACFQHCFPVCFPACPAVMRWAPMFREDAAEGAGDGSGELLSLEHKLAFLLWKVRHALLRL